MSAATTASAPERLYSLRQLSELGYGSRRANSDLIRAGRLPAVMVGGAYKVRESDLSYIAEPVRAAITDADNADDPNALAAHVVATWPRLSDEQQAEIARLLAA